MAIEGIFAIPMARISDIYGRRPVLMGSLVSVTVLSATLGLSQSLHTVLVVRVLCECPSGINLHRRWDTWHSKRYQDLHRRAFQCTNTFENVLGVHSVLCGGDVDVVSGPSQPS